MKYLTLLLTALAVLTISVPVSAGETRTEMDILSTRIGKWQTVVVRRGELEAPAEGGNPDGLSNAYYAIDLDSYTRDRDGQGVYRESSSRLLNCDASDVKVVSSSGAGVELELRFDGTQGAADSIVRVDASKKIDGDEVYFSVTFSGDGPVYDSFHRRYLEAVDGAEWVESVNTIRWSFTPANVGKR